MSKNSAKQRMEQLKEWLLVFKKNNNTTSRKRFNKTKYTKQDD